MIYLTDANVLSEPTKPAPNSQVVDWLTHNERNLVVDPIILGEVWAGILALPRGHKRTNLAEWFKNVRRQYQVDRADVADESRLAVLLLQDAHAEKPARIGVLDVGGATLEGRHGMACVAGPGRVEANVSA